MCTTVIAGAGSTVDGSVIVARSADNSAMRAQRYVIHPAAAHAAGDEYQGKSMGAVTDFRRAWPRRTMRYTTVPFWGTMLHGAVGFNEAGVGITATETIFASDKALAADPYDTERGITEDDIADVVLAEAKSARDAVLLLGRIVEEQGAGEGFGVGFADRSGAWYLETGSGHHWCAARIPDDAYFAAANQGRLRLYDADSPDWLGSKRLVEFAVEHGLHDPAKGPFDFKASYARDDERDRLYNDPRVWITQRILNPGMVQDMTAGRDFPVFARPEQPITLDAVKAIMRNHFDGTPHDPYAPGCADPRSPISVFRTYEAHILQVRTHLPAAIGNVVHLAFGMAELSVFLPMYWGLDALPRSFGAATGEADDESVYWRFRKLQTLVMTDYAGLAPMVKEAFAAFESEVERRRAAFEVAYVKAVQDDPLRAGLMLQEFSIGMFREAMDLAGSLLNRCFTARTASIEAASSFTNRGSKDH